VADFCVTLSEGKEKITLQIVFIKITYLVISTSFVMEAGSIVKDLAA
jgi:hypothetical protein